MPPLPLTPSPAVPYSTALTSMSGRPKEEWGKLLGDVPAAGAIPDRFLHHAEMIPHAGTKSSPEGTHDALSPAC
jgi:hypothetical protein